MYCSMSYKFRYENRVHEMVNNSILDSGYTIEKSPISIYHLGYMDNTIEHLAPKYKRNIELMNKSLTLDTLTDKQRDFMHSKLSNTYFEVVKIGGLDYVQDGKLYEKKVQIL